tara:strand:+ start:2520 stop:2750 length:231 start_codon:yes stop_codon:yes gene_type:complete
LIENRIEETKDKSALSFFVFGAAVFLSSDLVETVSSRISSSSSSSRFKATTTHDDAFVCARFFLSLSLMCFIQISR